MARPKPTSVRERLRAGGYAHEAMTLMNAAARAENVENATRAKDALPPTYRRMVEDTLIVREERDRYRTANEILRGQLVECRAGLGRMVHLDAVLDEEGAV